MSLERVFDKEKTRKILDVMPDEMIVWKTVCSIQNTWHVFWRATIGKYRSCEMPYRPGVNIAKPVEIAISWRPLKICYMAGFHSWAIRATAEANLAGTRYYTEYERGLVSALVKKEWITTLGVEGQNNIVIVSSKIHMPTYPNTDITRELGQIETPDVERVEELAGV